LLQLSPIGFKLPVVVLEQMGCLCVLVPLLDSGLISPSYCIELAIGEMRLFLGLVIDVPIKVVKIAIYTFYESIYA
jgi:hypothetical protein